MLESSLSLKINEKISSVVNDKIGANHFNKHCRITFKTNIQSDLFLDCIGSQYKRSFLISK